MADRKINIILRAVDKTKAAFSAVDQKVKGLGTSVATLARGFASVFSLAAIGGITGVAASLGQVTRELDKLAKTSRSLNTTVEAFSELQFIIGQTTDLTEQQFTTALQRLVKQIGKAQEEGGKLAETFEGLGLDLTELTELQGDQAFLAVAEALGRIDNEYEQAAIAQKLFEEGWRGVLGIVKAGPAAIDALREQYRKLGGPTQEAAEAAEQFNDQLDTLSKQIDALQFKAAPPVLKFLSQVLTGAGFGPAKTELREVGDELARVQVEIERLVDLQKDAERSTFFPESRSAIVQKRIDDLISIYKSLYDRREILQKESLQKQETAEEALASKAGEIASRGTTAIASQLERRKQIWSNYLVSLNQLTAEEEDLFRRIEEAGKDIVEGAAAAQKGTELDQGDLFLSFSDALAQFQGGDLEGARQSISNITEAMNQLNKEGNLNIVVANQLRQNLADLAKDIKATRQEKLVDSTLAQQEAAAASKAIEEAAKPKIKVELDPDSVDQIKAAVEAAMQGFSVPVTIDPVVGTRSGETREYIGSQGERSFGDTSAAEGHKL